MFDSVWFNCPKCGDNLEAQSKAGKCSLNDYNADDVPMRIATDLMGQHIHCSRCRVSYKIGAPIPSTVPMTLKTGRDAEDDEG